MSKVVEKTIIIGLDAPLPQSIQKYVKEGKLPNLAKLIENGTWAENCLVPHPTLTPPNWTTIVTGAWPGTHGVTCFWVHNPGDPLNKTHQAFRSTDCQSEYIWDVAERLGKKSIIINYPTSWPPTIKEGIQIAGAGLSVNDWRVGPNNEPNYSYISGEQSIAGEQLFSTEEYPRGDVVEIKEASGWKNVPEGDKLETKIKVGHRQNRDKVKVKEWYLLLLNSQGKGYDRVIISKSKDGKKDMLASLSVGEWSERITEEFETDKGKKEGVFRCKLVELSSDATALRLYLTPICQLDGWSYPEKITSELKDIDGMPLSGPGVGLHLEWIDVETWVEIADFENVWYGEAANYLLKNHDWNLFFMQAHTTDHAYHAFINKLDPHLCKDKKELARYQAAECKIYEGLDKMIGRILEAADENTLVMVVSDHGAVPTISRKEPDVGRILTKARLTVHKEENGKKVIDWEKTRAVAQRAVYIYVNLKGRDPQGIVEPGEEYEKVREEIIDLLTNYTDPETGKKPLSLVLKREDARPFGLYGDRVGDIIYAVKGEFSSEHGRQLPTAEFGIGSLKGLLFMSGPNIKKNHVLKRTVWLTDITPTICHLMDLPVPQDTEGAIIYQAMEDPNLKLHELEKIKKNYQRLKRAYEGEKALTHSYDGNL